MDGLLQLIDRLFVFGITETLVVLGAALVLIDYFFPTDWPAHLGYVLFALATGFAADMAGLSPRECVFVGLGTWVVLAILHRVLLRQYLENAPGTDGYEEEQDTVSSDAASREM